MLMLRLALVFLSVFAEASVLKVADSDSAGNPAVQKVVTMMKDMKKELEKEAEEEAALFDKALCACDGGEENLKKIIAHTSSEADRLTSKIAADTAEKAKLAEDLKAHKADKLQTENALEEATAVRQKEAKKYQDDDMMNRFSINAITQALNNFEKSGSAASFVQANPTANNFRRVIEMSRFISPTNREKVLEFLEDGAAPPPGVAPEMSSGVAQILGILKGMKDEITKDNKDLKDQEHTANEDFKAMKAAQLEKLGVLAKTIADKEKRSGDLALSLSQDKDALDDAEDERDDSTKYLANLDEECARKRKEKDTREQLRTQEIAAVGEAISILTDDEARATLKSAAGGAALLTTQSHPVMKDYEALMQTRNSLAQGASLRATVVSDKHHLAPHKNLLLAQQHAAKPDATEHAAQAEKVVHFMINNMVEVLHDDDVNDEHKKEFCVNETETYTRLTEEKTRLSERLSKQIEETTGELKMTIADIKMIEEEIYTLDKQVSEATELRKKEHTDFANTFATMDTARRLIDKAANRLQQFYNPKQAEMKAAGKFDVLLSVSADSKDLTPAARKMASDLSFLQRRSVSVQQSKVAPPEMVGTPEGYTKSSGGNSVIGMMNEIKSQMTLDMREAETDEKYSAKDYVRQMKDAVEDRAANVKRLHAKQAVKAKLEEKLLADKELRVLTVKELEQIAVYMVQLKAECDFLVRNFDARHMARVDEEVGLDSAETIVTHEAPPTHTETAEQFDEEHSQKQVDEHFPPADMPAPR